MIRVILLLLCLNLMACTQVPKKPKAMTQPDSMMQKGLQAYQQDNYLQAHQIFYKALALYRSIDDQAGQLQAHINLIEANLAIHRFKQVEVLVANMASEGVDKNILNSFKARLLFAQDNYAQALTLIESERLPLPAATTSLSSEQLNLLFKQFKYILFAAKTGDNKYALNAWFSRLAAEKTRFSNAQHILFLRLNAHYKAFLGENSQAIELMQSALQAYKTQVNRRGIATCLQALANFYLADNQPKKAANAFHRALYIRHWLKDEYQTTRLRAKIKTLSNK